MKVIFTEHMLYFLRYSNVPQRLMFFLHDKKRFFFFTKFQQLNRREGSHKIAQPEHNVEVESKEESSQPKQSKVFSTPRIKLKHNDITDEEFTLLMEHQKSLEEVSIYALNLIHFMLLF